MLRIEETILKSLIYDESYAKKVFPFLKSEYFSNIIEKTLFTEIHEYVNKYHNLPTHESLIINLSNKKDLSEEVVQDTIQLLNNIYLERQDLPKEDWLIDESEKFVQDKAIFNGIMESVTILDNKSNKSKGEIPKILSDALAISFDNNVGHDYINDSENRFEYYHRKESRIPFDIEYLNKVTKGGVPPKTLNVILAGCVHPNTKIKIRYRKRSSILTS